jgi:pimeloyl-ACP methyl ester carboxylesterase
MTEDAYKDIRSYRNEELVAMTHLSTNSKFMIDPDSSHNLQLDNPQLVAQAVEEVIRAIKEHANLSGLH